MSNALRTQERRRHIPADDASMLERENRKERASLRGRHRHQNLQCKYATRRPARDLRSTQQVQNQAQPEEVRIRRPSREVSRVHGLRSRNRSEPRESSSNRQDAGANRHQRRTAAHRKTRSLESFHQQIGRAHTAILPDAQKRGEIRVDRRSPQSIRGPEEDTLDPTNLGGTQRTRKVVPLSGSTQQRGKHNTRRRAHRRRQGPEHTKADLLPQHALDKIPAAVPALPEATTGPHHDLKKGVALLRRTSYHNREQCTTRGHPQQPWSDWASRRVEH